MREKPAHAGRPGSAERLKIEDLRNIYTSSRVELIELTGDALCYAEEKEEEGHNSLFLLEYNRNTKRERVITNYILNDPAFRRHYFPFAADLLMVLEDGGSEVWLLVLDRASGRERRMVRLDLLGGFTGCTALDSAHLLFWTQENEKTAGLFEDYHKLTGFDRVCCLYDLEEERCWYVRDPRLIQAGPEQLVPCRVTGCDRLLILEPHGDEAEKEKCFRNLRWLGDDVNDNVWLCPLLDAIVSIKAGDPKLPMELVLSVGTRGLLRYAGADAQGLYFRAKYFPDNDERLVVLHRETGAKEALCSLSHGENTRLLFLSGGSGPFRVYAVEDKGEEFACDGLFHASLHTVFSRELGDLIAVVEDRYLVARYLLADETDSFEFHTVLDAKTGSQQSYECRCTVQGRTVVLY